MPYVAARHRKVLTLCPLYGNIEVRRCYGCPYYKFRNNNFLVCDVEMRKTFGEHYQIVSKDPIIVLDDAGQEWVWTKDPARGYWWYKYVDGRADYDQPLEG